MKCIFIEPAESERQYQEFERLGRLLKLPVPRCFLEVEVTQKGKTLAHFKQRSHSWNRNAYNELFSSFASLNCTDGTFEAGKLSLRDVTGTVQSGAYPMCLTPNQSAQGMYGYISTDTSDMGIVVGTGNAPESFDGYALGAAIAHGSGAGQLTKSLATVTKGYDAGSKTFTALYSRLFTNDSGGLITVAETGIYVYLNGGGNQRNTMICRDVLASPVGIAATAVLRVRYSIGLVYPA